jgi:hypothetical protein
MWTNVVEKIKTCILCSVTFFRKSCRLWDNVEKYGGARVATNDDTIWRIRVVCWISKATRLLAHAYTYASGRTHTHTHTHTHTRMRPRAHTHWEQYAILIAFPRQQWFRNAHQCYVIRILPVLFCGSQFVQLNAGNVPRLSRPLLPTPFHLIMNHVTSRCCTASHRQHRKGHHYPIQFNPSHTATFCYTLATSSMLVACLSMYDPPLLNLGTIVHATESSPREIPIF